MILEKHDFRKKPDNLEQEILELKRMRNKDVADIKILNVELNKVQQLFRKYVALGGLRMQEQMQLAPLPLPERFLTYLERKEQQRQ